MKSFRALTIASCLLLASTGLFAEYKLQSAGAPPSELAPEIAALLDKTGHTVVAADGKPYCDVWFVSKAPTGPESAEIDLMWKTALPGSVIGAIKFHVEGHDRRGQMIKPGVYTLRFSMYPINGDHQGVAPNRDFLVMTPAEFDKKADPQPVFEALMNMSRKASGTPHPAVLSMWIVESDFKPGLSQLGENDWVIQTSIGGHNIALIVVGKTDA
jgi:hypothetical protein